MNAGSCGKSKGGSGVVLWWPYHNGNRVTTDGTYESAISFRVLADAKAFVEQRAS